MVMPTKSLPGVELLDADPQGSAAQWAGRRALADEPAVRRVDVFEVANALRLAAAAGVETAIVDTAPRLDAAGAGIARLADLVVIPCRPSALDYAAVAATAALVKAAGVPGAFVLNACPARSADVDDMRAALKAYGLPVAPVTIGERRLYVRTITNGLAVADLETTSKAAAEIAALCKWIRKELK